MRKPLWLSVVLLLALAQFHCDFFAGDEKDSGGGGGGGGDVGGETEDVQTPGEDLAEEPGEDTADNPCTDPCMPIGGRECVGDGAFKQCQAVDGCAAWSAPENCPEGEKCDPENGFCAAAQVCVDQCANVGVKSCTKEADKIIECQLDANDCKVLVEVELCAAGKKCENGECVAGGGGDTDCLEIVKCASGCANEQCVQTCGQQASPGGVQAYNDMGTCAQAECAALLDKPSAGQKCIIEKCPDEWTGCVGPWGTNTCMGMIQCAQACATADCQFDCLVSGSQAAQLKLWAVQECLEANCSQCGQQDQQCLQTCVQQKCMQQAMACQQG